MEPIVDGTSFGGSPAVQGGSVPGLRRGAGASSEEAGRLSKIGENGRNRLRAAISALCQSGCRILYYARPPPPPPPCELQAAHYFRVPYKTLLYLHVVKSYVVERWHNVVGTI